MEIKSLYVESNVLRLKPVQQFLSQSSIMEYIFFISSFFVYHIFLGLHTKQLYFTVLFYY